MSTEAPLRLLVVDDDEINREVIAEYLDGCGYQISNAEDGDVAIELLDKGPDRYDIVLLDRMMPRMDGLQVLLRMKDNPALSRIPVILQTARASPSDITEGMQAGAHYYLTKPFQESILKMVINTADRDRRHAQALQSTLTQRSRTLELMDSGQFRVQTLSQASDLATLLAHACPEPERVVTGLSELLINGIEHGNLGIGYDEKTRLNRCGDWSEEIRRRVQAPEHRNKWVQISFDRSPARLTFVVRDCGEGFDWDRYLEFEPERAFDNHGRGIAMANMLSFDRVEYVGAGNEVKAIVATREAPEAGAQ